MAPSFWQILLVLVIILILFGAGKLPIVIKQLGKGLKTFRSSLKEGSKKRKKQFNHKMFNIGWTELLLITIVFLIFIKPKDIPFFIKKIATFFYKIKNYISDITEEFKEEIYTD